MSKHALFLQLNEELPQTGRSDALEPIRAVVSNFTGIFQVSPLLTKVDRHVGNPNHCKLANSVLVARVTA